VIPAIGQAADLSFLENNGRISVEDGLIRFDEKNLEKSVTGVFAGCDVGGGSGSSKIINN